MCWTALRPFSADEAKVNGKAEHEISKSKGGNEEDQDKSTPLPDDDDPNGEKLASTQTPLDQLDTFAKHLEITGKNSAKAQEVLFDSFFARGMYR